ncbi:hypothetical protein BPOR_0264g00090 [Botrytis porri]|uniref:P-type ATPase C-terminal domain-containing protein n=2 Tax=Botrytis porri TaxID=87229 RepID=A0A4Z1KLK8_9HELO|nr:hypothetical protein BPOR_0264g00090 [Botrytis porri]
MHSKTYITAIGLILSIGGWFFWNLLLSAVYSPESLTYNVRNGFIDHYGRNPLWWCTLIAILAAVTVLEVGVSSMRKTFWGNDIEAWQELEKDPGVWRRLEGAVKGEDGVDLETGGDGKRSQEELEEGEREIAELLERPRIMHSEGRVGEQEKERERPMSSGTGVAKISRHLRMRKGSTADAGVGVGFAAGASIEDYDDEIGHGHGHVITSPIIATDMTGGNGIKGTKRRAFSFSFPGMKG